MILAFNLLVIMSSQYSTDFYSTNDGSVKLCTFYNNYYIFKMKVFVFSIPAEIC